MRDRLLSPLDSAPATEQSPAGVALAGGDLYRLLVEGVKDYAIFALDVNGYVLSWNAGAQRIKGYTAQEAIGQHFSIFYPAERRAEKFPEYELAEAARLGRFEDEGWRVRKDGSRFWANVVITALRDPSGKLLGYGRVTRDLSERRAAEEALRVSEERFRLLVQGVKDYAIFGLDPEGNVSTWNEGAERIKGYTANEIIGRHFSAFYPPEDIANGKPARELEIASRTGRYEEEGIRLRKDGSRFWASVLITAIRNSDGRLIGYAKVTRDLTERRAAEAERQAREKADEANRVKSEFLAAMSHELRTPLNAIGGYTDLLLLGVRGSVNAAQVEDLERIKRSQQHLLGVINDILGFSRLEAGRATYEFAAVPIREAMNHTAEMIAPLAASKGLQFTTANCPADATVWADRSKVDQIIINLLSNAVKFTQQGSVAISCASNGGEHIDITVRDTGPGIPKDQVGRIFEPFFQVGRSLTSAHEGTGLGLAISRDLAQAMGGDITVESREGEGSAFTLRLRKSEAAGRPD